MIITMNHHADAFCLPTNPSWFLVFCWAAWLFLKGHVGFPRATLVSAFSGSFVLPKQSRKLFIVVARYYRIPEILHINAGRGGHMLRREYRCWFLWIQIF